MKREVRRLKEKAVASLVLSIELFNRPHSDGRVDGVLLHADHAFEMLLKAVIRHRGGEIREPGEAHTIGFKVCLSRCLTSTGIQCLTPEQAITLQALNGWRDAAQHYLLELSEQQLYLASQGRRDLRPVSVAAYASQRGPGATFCLAGSWVFCPDEEATDATSVELREKLS